MFAANGVHHLPLEVTRMWWGAVLASGCLGMLGVALGAAARHTVGTTRNRTSWTWLTDHPDLRGHQPDPTPGHLQEAVQL